MTCVDHVGSFSLSYNTKKICMTRCESTYTTIQLLSRILDYTEMRHVIFIFFHLNLKSHSYTIFLRCTRRPICEWKCIPSSHPVAKQLQWECEEKKVHKKMSYKNTTIIYRRLLMTSTIVLSAANYPKIKLLNSSCPQIKYENQNLQG